MSATPLRAQVPSDGVLMMAALTSASDYCHLQFPAIREGTLGSDRPVLKNPESSDIVDYYGPCDHDPLGYEERIIQRQEEGHRLEIEYGD